MQESKTLFDKEGNPYTFKQSTTALSRKQKRDRQKKMQKFNKMMMNKPVSEEKWELFLCAYRNVKAETECLRLTIQDFNSLYANIVPFLTFQKVRVKQDSNYIIIFKPNSNQIISKEIKEVNF